MVAVVSGYRAEQGKGPVVAVWAGRVGAAAALPALGVRAHLTGGGTTDAVITAGLALVLMAGIRSIERTDGTAPVVVGVAAAGFLAVAMGIDDPVAPVAAALVDFAVAFVVLLVMMLWYGRLPGWNVFLIPPALLLTVVAALGIGTLIAALNVAYRDFRYVVTFLVQLWMFATPSIYSDVNRTDGPFALIYLNPMTAVIDFFRGATLGSARR